MYYSGSPSYTSAPYSYGSSVSPYGSSYSASYINPGGNYSSHSSLGGYSRTPLTSRWLTSGSRTYSPMLTTISEKVTLGPVRINSPRRTPISNRNFISSQYTHRPININTADIDVSRDKYRYKNTTNNYDISTRLPPRTDSPKTTKENVHDKPNTGIDSSPGPKRTTIKRERTVVRLHTVKRKERDSPRKPIEDVHIKDTSTSTNSENVDNENDSMKWRQKLADDLSYKVQKEKKSLGAKLVEKFTLKEKEDNEIGLKTKMPLSSENNKDKITDNKNFNESNLLNRRCSMDLLAEQACLFDSLIRRENLSTASLDLSKVGKPNETPEDTDLKNTKRRKTQGQQNPLTTTKSDQCLHDRLLNKTFNDKKQLKRQSLKKCLSGSNIHKLDSITELPKNIGLSIPNKMKNIEVSKKSHENVKLKIKNKISSSIEISTTPTPLKFIVENVTVEKISRPYKKDIIYTSTVDEYVSLDQSAENREGNDNFRIENMLIDTKNNTSIKSDNFLNQPNLEITNEATSPEPADGDFWDKIGKRETVYLSKRKQNIQNIQEKIKRSFWFPEEEVEVVESDLNSVNSVTEKESNDKEFEINDLQVLKTNDLRANKNTLDDEKTSLKKPDKKKLQNECVSIGPFDVSIENIKSKVANKNMSNKKYQKEDKEYNDLLQGENQLGIQNNTNYVYNIEKKESENNKKDGLCEDIEIKKKKTSKPDEKKDKSPKLYIKSKLPEQCYTNQNDLSPKKHCLTLSEIKVLDKNEGQSNFKTSTPIKEPVNEDNSYKDVTDIKKKLSITKLNEKSVKNKQKISKALLKTPSTGNLKNYGTDLVHESNYILNSNKIENFVEKESTNHLNPEIITNLNNGSENVYQSSKQFLTENDISNVETKISTKEYSIHKKENRSEVNINEEENTFDLLSSPNNLISNESTSNIINIPNNEVNFKTSINENNCGLNIIEAPEDKKHDKITAKNVKSPPGKLKEEKSQLLLIATPRPLQKRSPQVIRSSSSSEASEDSSEDDENEKKSESSEGESTEFLECENNADGRTSTGSNDSGFDSSAPTSPASFLHVKKDMRFQHMHESLAWLKHSKLQKITEPQEQANVLFVVDCDVNCHRKCEKLTANLCGVNQRLLVEALATGTTSKKGGDSPSTSTSPAPPQTYNSDISEQELEHSTAFDIFRRTGRFTPPARSIPRFRKYTIDDFQFIRVLGKGSFGKVMLAELRDTEYYYAVKCLKKDVVLEDDDVECTLIERKVLALGTNHPYLCHLFATFQTDSHLFFVMEYLNGGDLMFHIQQSGRFQEGRARLYAAEIVSGLKFLHKRGIVYRDLKLDNILLDFDGHVRIADFGMCKLQIYLDKTADTFCGTPDYMAPEIIKGLKYNQTVDWWSFGVLLYEMLIGQSPFSGCDEDELFWSICNEMPSYPRFLSKEALNILTGLLDKDARSRLGGAECALGDVRDQDFFRLINWERLERRDLEAPFKPRVRHPMDTQYFDRAFTGERPRLTTVEPQVLRSMDQEPFRGFSYTNPNATDR